MKKLILIRHAEAEPETEKLPDFERNLTVTGKQDAAKMAALLLNQATLPETIICSPAVRALTTAQIFTVTLGLEEAKTNLKIYEADADTLLQIINQLDDQNEVIALVGHNPGVSNILYFLTGKITTMPTSAWAEVELQADSWAEVGKDCSNIIQYQYS
ncbi:MAG: SixA phosphatase family protein [Janthinobacterium lividum]